MLTFFTKFVTFLSCHFAHARRIVSINCNPRQNLFKHQPFIAMLLLPQPVHYMRYQTLTNCSCLIVPLSHTLSPPPHQSMLTRHARIYRLQIGGSTIDQGEKGDVLHYRFKKVFKEFFLRLWIIIPLIR